MSNVFIINYKENDQFDTNLELREIIALKTSSHEQLRILAVAGYDRIDNVSGYFMYDISPELVDSPVENSMKIIEKFFSSLDIVYSEELISLDQYDLSNIQRKLDEDFDPLNSPEDLLEIAKASDSWATLGIEEESFSKPKEKQLNIFDRLQSFLQESQDNETSLVDWLESEYQISFKHSRQAEELPNAKLESLNALLSFDELDAEMILKASQLKTTKDNIALALKEMNFFLNKSQIKQLISGFIIDLFTSYPLRNMFS